MLIDPQQGEELRPLLAERGVTLGDDVIIEEFVQLFAGATLGVEPVVGPASALVRRQGSPRGRVRAGFA